MIGNKTKTYFFALFSFIAVSFITVASIIIGVVGFPNNDTFPQTADLLATNLDRNIAEDKDMDNFLKERTMSLYFANNNSSKSYNGTYGTGWIYGFDSLNEDTNDFKIYVATNIHVIDEFISQDYQLNFDILFLQFFKNADDKKPYGQVGDRLFLENKDVKLSLDSKFSNNNLSNNNAPDLRYPINYPINGVPIVKDNDGLWENKDDKTWYIQRSYSDVAILEFSINNNSNPYLYHWMKYGYSKSPRSLNNFQSLVIDQNITIEGEREPSITEIQEYYIGGFPIINNKPTWISKKYKYEERKLQNLKNISNFDLYKARFTTAYQVLPDKFVEGCSNGALEHSEPGLHIPANPNKNPNNYYRSISQQILLPFTNMGSGASGSMMVTKNKDIVGIWWGLYTNNRDGDYYGAADLFIAPNEYLAENVVGRNAQWPAYDNSYKPKIFSKN